VRSLLHAPRSSKRGIGAAAAVVLALVASLLTITPAQALSDTGTGGVFVPTTGRILDTKNNIGGYSTPMPADTYRTVKVAGLAGIPDDGSAGAVSVVATVADISAQGTLFGRPDADTNQTMMGIYGGDDKQTTSFSAVLAVGSDGTIQVKTNTSARLILDVQGYYTSTDDGTAPGGFVPMNGKRIADTRSGLGAPQAALASTQSVDVQVTGTAGVPAGASAVIVNLIAVPTIDKGGWLTPYATGTTRPANSLNYAAGTATSMQAQVPLSASGKMTVWNGGSTTDVVVDVQGYFTAAGKGGAVFTPGAGRAYDSRATGNTALGKNETRSIQIAGKAGVPVMGSGITAVVLTLTSLATNGAGNATVWADGTTRPNTTSINFTDGTIRTNTITVPLGANGKIALNNVADVTNYVIDIQGWYTNPLTPTISCPGYENQTVIAAAPADAVSCTVTAAPATQSNEELAIGVDSGEYLRTVLLSNSASTSQTISVPNSSGEHTIEAARMNGDSTSVATYRFTLGDWRSNDYAADDAVVDATALTPTLPVPDGGVPLPADALVRYSIFTDADTGTAIASSDWLDGSWHVPAGTLQDGATYYWSAEIQASIDYAGNMAVVTTGRYAIAPSSSVPDGAAALADDSDDDATITYSDADAGPSCTGDVCSQAEGFTGWSAYSRKVIKKSLVDSNHRGGKLSGAYCHGSSKKGCDISTAVTLSNSTQVGFGLSANSVSSSFNYTSTDTKTTTATCHSAVNRGVQAYNGGYYWQYKITETRHFINAGRTTNDTETHTTGWLHAFHYRGVLCVDTK